MVNWMSFYGFPCFVKTTKKIPLLFIQGGGQDGYHAEQSMVASLRYSLPDQFQVYYPELRTEESQRDFGFCDQIGAELSKIPDPLILVGHSFGASMILKFLTEHHFTSAVTGVFLLATPFWNGKAHWVQGIMLKDGFAAKLDAELPLYFYHCFDDQEVAISHLEDYRKCLPQANFNVKQSGGHQLNNNLSFLAADIKSLTSII